jgi:hypothetical protein
MHWVGEGPQQPLASAPRAFSEARDDCGVLRLRVLGATAETPQALNASSNCSKSGRKGRVLVEQLRTPGSSTLPLEED